MSRDTIALQFHGTGHVDEEWQCSEEDIWTQILPGGQSRNQTKAHRSLSCAAGR